MEIENYNLNDELSFNEVAEINDNQNFSKSELLILHVNIRSIRKNFIKLEAMINSFISKPDVIICSESWLIDDIKFVNLTGYNRLDNNSRINKADGVVIYKLA